MASILSIVLPIFGLIGLGYGSMDPVPRSARRPGLSDYVFALAIPALIFQTLPRATLTNQRPWGYWIAYFAAVGLVWVMAMFIAKRWFGANHLESVIAGVCAAQASTVLVDVPLLLKTFGEAGGNAAISTFGRSPALNCDNGDPSDRGQQSKRGFPDIVAFDL